MNSSLADSDYKYQPRPSGKLTISQISKTLKRWMNRQDKKDFEQQFHFIISDALELVFTELKNIFQNDKESCFDQMMKIYIDLFQCTGNNKYRFLVENHMKELLKTENYKDYSQRQTYYQFFCQIFDYFPFLVFKIIQSKYKLIFQRPLEGVIKLYGIYIRFANTRKNDKLIEKYIQEEVNSSHGSLDKLNILLSTYSNSHTKVIRENPLKQILKIIIQYDGQSDQRSGWEMQENQVRNFCETLFKINWPYPLESAKSTIAFSVVKKWQDDVLAPPPKKCINTIMNSISIDHQIKKFQQAVLEKMKERSENEQNYGLNCQFVRIVLDKFSRQQCQKLLSKERFLEQINEIVKNEYNREEKIKLLEVIRSKQIYQLSNQIEEQLVEMIKQRFLFIRPFYEENQKQELQKSMENLIFGLKAIRLYKFKKFDRVYNNFKKTILKDSKLAKQCKKNLKLQILQVCLHYCKHNEFKTVPEEKAVFRDIIQFIGQEIDLKIAMIQYIVENLDQRFFNEKDIYTIYRESKYEYLLYEDYATNDIVIKIFSIKTICYLAEDTQTQYRFFLKNAFYVICDRLRIKGLLSPEEKRTSLQVIREIIRYRGEMFQKEADDLSTLLISELQKSIQFHSPQMNSVSVYILKIFQALMKKIPIKMMRYVPCLAQYAINIINFKIIKKQLKKLAVQTFCQMAQSCHYVVLPYFHFPNFYDIIRQVLLSDDHYYYYQAQMLRLIGLIGYIGQQEYIGLQVLNLKSSNVEQNFQAIFRETFFLRQYKNQLNNGKSSLKYKKMIIQDSFYNEEKMSKTAIEIDQYRQYILITVTNNISLSIAEATLSKSLKTIQNLIPVLDNAKDQVFFHKLLFNRLFEIEQKYHNQVLSILFLLLSYHNIETHCNDILKHYVKKMYNHKREDDLIKLMCMLTEKYSHMVVGDELVNVIIVVKKIIMDCVELGQQQEQKIKFCFNIIINIGGKIDRVLHLFFADINKLFSYNHDKYQQNNQNQIKDDISQSILQSYITFMMQLTNICPSLQYFLPFIRQFLIAYFNRQLSHNRNRERSRQIYHQKNQFDDRFLKKIIDAMIFLMTKYGKQCQSFINLLHSNIKSNNINHKLYNICQSYLKKNSNLDYLRCQFKEEDLKRLWNNERRSNHVLKNSDDRAIYQAGNQIKIVKQFQMFCLQQNHTDEQDQLWFDNLSNEVFLNSNEDVIRACSELAAYDKLFSYSLFEVPFYFFWKSLYQNVQETYYYYEDFNHLTEVKKPYAPNEKVIKLTLKLKTILVRKDISLKIRQKFLDCIYFIERCQIPIMIKDKVLYDVAIDVQDSVKALFYLEREYQYDPDVYKESLIEQYSEIGEKQSAIGLFRTIKLNQSAIKQNTIKLSQKLGPTVEFVEELNSRREKEKNESGRRDKGQQLNILDLELKRDICDWQSISKLIEKESPKPNANKSKLAHFAIEAAINLGQWEDAKGWTPFLEQSKVNEEVKIWLSMIKIYQKKYEQAEKKISQIRQDMYYKIRQMFSLSYDKSMKGILILQQASELEEISRYFKVNEIKNTQNKFNQAEAENRKNSLIRLWNDRLQGLKNNLYSMQKILTVRSLLLSKSEDFDNWIIFSKLALKENQKYLARLTYKQLQALKITDKKKNLELLLISLQIQILEQVSTNENAFSTIQQRIVNEKLIEDKNSLPLIFEIYQKYSQRAIEQQKFTTEQGNKFIKILKAFPGLKDYYELSHYMGLLNIKLWQVVSEQQKKKTKVDRKPTVNVAQWQIDISKVKQDQLDDKSFFQRKLQYLMNALKCFIKSVTFNQRQNKFFLEDCLKILNLISMGNNSKLIDQMRANYTSIPREGLIQIIPQLIARLDNECVTYKELMKDIIIFIGKQHTQTLLFPLIYMKRSYKSESKKELAEQIISKISESDSSGRSNIKELFEKAEQIVEQISKISLKLSEKVFLFMKKIIKMAKDGKMSHMGLTTKTIEFCENILSQNQKLSSPSEFGFIQEEKSALMLTIQNLMIYKELQQQLYFDEALNLMKEIQDRTKQTLSSIKTIYLEEASYKLFKISKSQIYLFGTYAAHSKNIKIDSFKNQIQIIHSKQRPKKIVIIGSDQKEYNYLIKGKQDLRLDERIMQLFTFINKMFHSPSEKESYSIQGYSITPISYEIGIISWVENCDTMGELIQSYRYANGVRVEHGKIESKLCRHIYQKYPDIEKYHKVEIYHQVINQISGMDLRNIFCQRSQTSEKWLKKRSCFIRSLAVMSIVGYIIGLGDRHPFNIMIQRDTWKVVHIDFGDCFEVNKMRKIFPEKVPFRLTRMLVNTMEACKTDGIFKHTCEKIMKILRMNKQSILVIVEAFKYDPLFGWKITSKGEKEGEFQFERMQGEGYEAFMLDEEGEKEETIIYLERKGLEATKHILKIIRNKLIGKENDKSQHGLSESQQVDKLIKEAMSPLNLVQHFENWCIFW